MRILSGELRQKHGLETDSGSMYHKLVMEGHGDLEAQYMVYKSRGLI